MSEHAPVVIVVSAPSGAGKTTVIERVLADLPGIRFSVSHTTRPPRDGEREGVDYHFVERAAFERLRDENKLLESAEVHGNLYGTSRAELEAARAEGKDVLLDLDVQGAAQVRACLPEAVTVFILPPSYPALERRLRGRGQDDEATIQRRLAVAACEIAKVTDYDYALVNDDVDACVEELKTIIRAERCRVSVMGQRVREICKDFRDERGDQ